MPEIETKEKEKKSEKDEDVVVKVGSLRFYFQNYYTLISLGNDILTGTLYLIGSLCNLFGAPAIYGNILFVLGGIFLLARPLIKVFHNIYIYNADKIRKQTDDANFDDDQSFQVRKGNGGAIGESYNDEYYDSENEDEERNQ